MEPGSRNCNAMKRLFRVCLYGPESTGKSTLARRLAEHYGTEFVPEVAREIITSNAFTAEDIIRIGQAQTDRVLEKSKSANRVLFCDTDVITTAVYSDTYLHHIPPQLDALEKKVHYDQYFLFDIDVPWVADGLRDMGAREQRVRMFERFKKELDRRGIPYIRLTGSYDDREKMIVRVVDEWLRNAETSA